MSANNFKLTLDTIAPAGSFVETGSVFANNSVSIGLNTDGASYMKVWITAANATVSTVPNDSDVPWIPASSTWTAVFGNGDNDNANYKIHAVFMDDVGNTSNIVHSGTYVYDTIAPSMSANCYAYDTDDVNSKTYTNSKTFGIHIEAKDEGAAPTGLQKVVISCSDFTADYERQVSSFTESTTAYGASSGYTGQLEFKSSAVDGQKTITITAYDNAGNTSTKTIQIYLDTAISETTTTLKATASDENPLIANIKASNNSFVAIVETDATDIVEYQLYGDITGTPTTTSSTWKTWPTSGSTSETFTGLAFTTDQDGTKSVYVKLKDRAGNISTAPTVTRVYDATAPAVTLTRGNEWIAAGNGTVNNTTITYTATDATSGLTSTVFDCNGSTITGVSGGSFSFSASTPGAQTGANTITITATDAAGNVNSTSVVVNIEASFTIDSLTLAGYELYSAIYRADTKNNISVTVVNSTPPGSGRSKLYVWCSNVANEETVAANTSDVDWTSGSQAVSSSSINKAGFVSNSSSNSLHVKAVSAVGNVAYKHVTFTIDEKAPTFKIAATPVVRARTNTVVLSEMADELPGTLEKMQITAKSGTILTSGATNGWVAASSGNVSVVLSDTLNSGTYGVIVQVRDQAGNITTKEVTWEYDSVAPSGTLVLKEADGTTNKASPSAVNTFKAVITYTVDSTDTYSDIKYRIWGDFALTDGGTQVATAPDTWTTLTGNTITTDTLYCTPNGSGYPNGLDKTIQCELMDNAGNTKTVESAIFKYNPNRALITLQNISSRRISCVSVPRKTSSGGTVSDTLDYADQVSFDITCDQDINEIKVAAYHSSNLPDSQLAGDSVTPITALSGSNGQNYTRSGTNGAAITMPVHVVIDGKDYRAALGGSASNNVDGTHYVVVFGRNLAGVWSIVGTLEV